MYNFNLEIQFGNREFGSGDTSWIDSYVLSLEHFSRFSEQEMDSFASMAKADIERNLFTSKTFEGSPVAPLAKATIKKKGHSKVFFDKGVLYRAIAIRKIPDGREIFIREPRAEIAAILQEGSDKMPARPFFGIIPARAEANLREIINKRQYSNVA